MRSVRRSSPRNGEQRHRGVRALPRARLLRAARCAGRAWRARLRARPHDARLRLVARWELSAPSIEAIGGVDVTRCSHDSPRGSAPRRRREVDRRMIEVSVPVRICDIGGWTDTWFGGPGRVVNIAVTPGVRRLVRAIGARVGCCSMCRAPMTATRSSRARPAVARHPLSKPRSTLCPPPDDLAVEIQRRVPPSRQAAVPDLGGGRRRARWARLRGVAFRTVVGHARSRTPRTGSRSRSSVSRAASRTS